MYLAENDGIKKEQNEKYNEKLMTCDDFFYENSYEIEKIEENKIKNKNRDTFIQTLAFRSFFSMPIGWLRILYIDIYNSIPIFTENKYNRLLQNLEEKGYNAKIVHTKPKVNYFTNLRNEFIIVKCDEDCECFGSEIVIDISFRDKFIITRPTERYTQLMKCIPNIFVGTWAHLVHGVNLISQEIENSFAENNLILPPWRKQKSLLSKWNINEGNKYMIREKIKKSPNLSASHNIENFMHTFEMYQYIKD